MCRATPCALVALALLFATGCGPSSALPGASSEPSSRFDADGVPFSAEASFVGPGRLEVAAEVPLSSLPFTQRGDSASGRRVAPIAISVRVLRRESGTAVGSAAVLDTVVLEASSSTHRDSSVLRVDTFAVAPGAYEAVVEAASGRSRSTRQVQAIVPAPSEAAVSFPRLWQCARGTCRRAVRSPLVLPADSFVAESSWSGSGPPTLEVYRLRRDTSVARAPYWVGPPVGSLEAREVSLDLAEAERIAAASGRGRTVRTRVGSGDPGAYALVATGRDRRATRYLAVMPPGFPEVGTLDEAIGALAYIAYPSELQRIREGGAAPARREAFDRFWADLLGGRVAAGRTLRRYYGRVAEANRLYTTSKPGWKTDRGMVHVVFGPPAYVDRLPDAEVWHYGVAGRGSETFVFDRGAGGYGTTGTAFEPYLLRRSEAYERAWRRAIRIWRTGE